LFAIPFEGMSPDFSVYLNHLGVLVGKARTNKLIQDAGKPWMPGRRKGDDPCVGLETDDSASTENDHLR
jgi:hypothetical protein